MSQEATIMSVTSAEAQNALHTGSRPMVNKKGEVLLRTPRGLVVNSALRKDEWEELDRSVLQAAQAPLAMVNRFQAAGLVRRLGGLGTLIAQYNKVGEMTQANVSLSGTAIGDKDLLDYDLTGVPVPVIFKEFEINQRYLESSRRSGDAIDTLNGQAAARVVGEKVENLLISGDTSINLNGNTIYGLTTHPDRNTLAASAVSGVTNAGDFGTLGNIVPVVSAAISMARADNYRGPYGIFIADDQYDQLTMQFYSDGSGQSALQRIMGIPNISFVDSSAWLTSGQMVLVNMSSEVIELAYVPAYWPIVNLEWTSGDGMQSMFKVMTVFTPIVKSDYGNRSGIVHVSGV